MPAGLHPAEEIFKKKHLQVEMLSDISSAESCNLFDVSRCKVLMSGSKGQILMCFNERGLICSICPCYPQGKASSPTTKIPGTLPPPLKTNWVIKLKQGSYSYKAMYPTGCVPPKFYGLPKIHKPDTPLRPIVSVVGLSLMVKNLLKFSNP